MPKKPRKNETIETMTVESLEEGGYDGLYSPSGVCCCYIRKGDCPCDDPNLDCTAGHVHEDNITVSTIVSKHGIIPALTIEPPWKIVD